MQRPKDSHEAAALWGTAENAAQPESVRLACALAALEWFEPVMAVGDALAALELELDAIALRATSVENDVIGVRGRVVDLKNWVGRTRREMYKESGETDE